MGRTERLRESEMSKDKYYGKTLRKNFARHEEVMDAEDDRHHNVVEEAEFQESGFDIEDAPDDAGADAGLDGGDDAGFDDE